MDSKTETTAPNSEKAKRAKHEIIVSILLSLAALSAAWCGYQSKLWGGVQTFKLADVNSSNRKAQEKNIILTQRRAVDADIAMNFINAYSEGSQKKMDFYLNRTRPEIRKIFSTWMELDKTNAPDAPPHPLAMREYEELYKNSVDSVAMFRALGETLYDEAETANHNADNYIMLTVFFSSVLFLGGLSTQLTVIKAKKILIGVAAILYLCSVSYLILKMPYTSGL